MPLYEYDCPIHGRYELLQKIEDRHTGKCEQCKRVFSPDICLREANPFTWYRKNIDGTRTELKKVRDH